MSCWKCKECGQTNCDIEKCHNPACPSNKKKIPKDVQIDTFPKEGDTFTTGIPEKVTREF